MKSKIYKNTNCEGPSKKYDGVQPITYAVIALFLRPAFATGNLNSAALGSTGIKRFKGLKEAHACLKRIYAK